MRKIMRRRSKVYNDPMFEIDVSRDLKIFTDYFKYFEALTKFIRSL